LKRANRGGHLGVHLLAVAAQAFRALPHLMRNTPTPTGRIANGIVQSRRTIPCG
jgi:hypothetical protein